jgi:hypothetical protein
MIDINIIKSMKTEELQELKQIISAEIESRLQSTSPRLVLYTHRCKGCSNHHMHKYKHWAKIVKHIDTTKTNGYAFEGEFISPWAEHKLPVGTIVVEVCDMKIKAFRLGENGKELLGEARTDEMSGFIDELAKVVNA